MTSALSAWIGRVAAECDVPGCYACTLLRVSVRLRWLVFVLGFLCGAAGTALALWAARWIGVLRLL